MPPGDLLLTIIVMGGGFLLLRPIVAALADRIRHKSLPAGEAGAGATEYTAVLDELREIRQDLADLAERVDFTERMLAKQREGERLAAPRGDAGER